MASITIIRKTSPFTPDMQSYDMQLEATTAAGMPKEIFVFKSRVSGDPEFISIADPVDLEEYPVDAPGTPENPYFRAATVRLRFRSVLDLAETWQYITDDVTKLVNTLNAGVGTEAGGETETVVF